MGAHQAIGMTGGTELRSHYASWRTSNGRRMVCVALSLQELDNFGHISIREAEIWHLHLLIFFEEGYSERSWDVKEFVRLFNKPCSQSWSRNVCHSLKIRADGVTVSNGVAGGAMRGENILPRIKLHGGLQRHSWAGLLPAYL